MASNVHNVHALDPSATQNPDMNRWGTLTSLYGDLSPQQVGLVEAAIRSCSFGDFENARRIFQEELPSEPFLPIVALEHANTFSYYGAYNLEAERLAEALSTIEESRLVVSPEVRWLIRINLAAARLESEGMLKAALQEARSLRAWLINVKIDDYSDVMVQCIASYQTIIYLSGIWSNWLQEGIDGDLPTTPAKSSLASLTKLRRFLQKAGRFQECQSLVKMEGVFGTPKSSIDPYNEFFSVDWDVSNRESVACRMVLLRIWHAEWLHNQELHDETTEEREKTARLALEHAKEALDTSKPRHILLYSAIDNTINPACVAEEQIQRHRDLARRALLLGDRVIQRKQLSATLSYALEAATRTRLGTSHLAAHIVVQEIIHETISFGAETHPHPATIARSLSDLADSEYLDSNLEWIQHLDRFFERWPNFDLPLFLVRLLGNKYRGTQKSAGDAAAAFIVPEHAKALANHPSIRKSEDGTLESLDDDGELVLAMSPSLVEQDWLFGTSLYIVKLLIRWIKYETVNIMPESQARKILVYTGIDFRHWLDQVDPAGVVVNIFGSDDPIDHSRWNSWFEEVVLWLKDSDLPPSELVRHQQLVRICQCRVSWLSKDIKKIKSMSPEEALEYQIQSRDEMGFVLQICRSLRADAVPDSKLMVMKANLTASDFHLLFSPQGQPTGTFTDEAMMEIQKSHEAYVNFLRSGYSQNMLFVQLKTLARAMWIRWLSFDTVPIIEALKLLEEADELFHRFSGQGFILQALQAFSSHMLIADGYQVSLLYESGVKYAFEAWRRWVQRNRKWLLENPDRRPPEEMQQISMNLIKWMQKSKARALALAMGLGAQVPQDVLKGSSSPDLTAKYNKLRKELDLGTSIPRAIEIYKELESTWATMESDTTSGAFFGMFRGRTVNSGELNWLCALFGEDVIFVDWIQIPSMGGSGDLAKAVYQNGLLADVLATGLKLEEVEAWVAENLDPAPDLYDDGEENAFLPLTKRHDTERLDKLNGLLEGLERFAKPDQILVFCPTKAMNRIPLHALQLDNEVCIVRNPVVYCQSLTLLRLCLLDHVLADGHLSDRQPLVIDPLNDNHRTAMALSDIASTLNTNVSHLDLSSPSITPQTNNDESHPSRKEAFVRLTSNASMVHFHGHVIFDPSDPMQHHLQLAPQPFSPDGDPLPLPSDAQLTARDIFALRFRPGTHVTTISCKSARAHVTKVDDHVGLVAAFHCAGAVSMISSLWNIYEDTGMRFSRLFYKNLAQEEERFFVEPVLEKPREQRAKLTEFPYLDMARALQKTIVEIRRDEKSGEVLAPYFWAGLVLNGNWVMPKVWMDGRGTGGL